MRFSSNQLRFLSKNYIARIATCNRRMQPHISPIYFANYSDSIFFATERGTRKFRDIVENGSASLVVDDFDADWLHGRKGSKTRERAVIVYGPTSIFEGGPKYHSMYLKLFSKYPDYREEDWKERESPIIKIWAEKIISWGL